MNNANQAILTMKQFKIFFSSLILVLFLTSSLCAQDIPLPEHPRPDHERPMWVNLNGDWIFSFDEEDQGLDENWGNGKTDFDKRISVPFPWGSELSGLEDEADIGWYRREIMVDPAWKGKRVFLIIGASDWQTDVWLDGIYLGKHQGGYVPFEFELSKNVRFGETQELIVRVDDARRDFTLYGKQGYGNARGIWQTTYLEARGNEYLETLHISPDIDLEKVSVTAYLPEKATKDLALELRIKTPGEVITSSITIPEGKNKYTFEIPVPGPRLWNLDDPYLYEVKASLEEDELNTYFGMRKISVVDLPGTEYPYIALNNEPIYVQLALDQSYHPEGFYTFPDDQFMKDEILRSKSIGLNGIRTHIKVEVPRKLYWADKLGLLVMEDLPNSWGEPDLEMQEESEYTLREMIKRDYNHPSIFSWVIFNETWGLFTDKGKNANGRAIRTYEPSSQAWVASMYYLAKSLDMTRLVEDNSICCGRGHTETDINSWHSYLPGYKWDEDLKKITEENYEGSGALFEDGYTAGRQPNINSECGNVWGYDGSTGDVDWSWDYHRMINTFRIYPEVAGWLYTEHHDVINEWNGYWRFDRSEKFTGMEEIMDGMNLNDLHADVYLSTGNDICVSVKGGEEVEVPLYLSVMTGDDHGKELTLQYELIVTNMIGEEASILSGTRQVAYQPYLQAELDPLAFRVPDISGLALLKLSLHDAEGSVLMKNFMHFELASEQDVPKTQVLSVAAGDLSGSDWDQGQWDVLEGKKVNGAGKGYFEYSITLPSALLKSKIKESYFVIELSAKEMFVKDKVKYNSEQDFMRGSLVSPSANPNSYPMTDEEMFPSEVSIMVNGTKALAVTLADDPADHRGVLSWHHQLQDRKLREAGSYGYLVKIPLKKKVLQGAIEQGQLDIRIQTEGSGGVAVYGKEFGRYPVDPSLVLRYK